MTVIEEVTEESVDEKNAAEATIIIICKKKKGKSEEDKIQNKEIEQLTKQLELVSHFLYNLLQQQH